MLVEQIWTANAGRNFNYLIACPETGEALAVDPLDAEKCLAAAKRRGWTITQILNTHEHRDHTGGNDQMIAATGAKLLAHANAKDRIAGIDRGLKAGDAIKIGPHRRTRMPGYAGHTMSHICVLAHGATRALFCGDTLFNAGAGNCHNGGHPNELYNTFATQLSKLPDDTLVYPGHDYISQQSAVYAGSRAGQRQGQGIAAGHGKAGHQPPARDDVGLEKEINTFFRLTSPSVIRRLREAFPDLPDNPDQKTVFLKLRELRNKW